MERLKTGVYKDIYNVNAKVFEKLVGKQAEQEEEEEDEEEYVGVVDMESEEPEEEM